MKTTRRFALTQWIADQTRSMNRSLAAQTALSQAEKDPLILVKALERRVLGKTDHENGANVTLSVDQQFLDNLQTLATKSGLQAEFVLRLVMEDYLSQQ